MNIIQKILNKYILQLLEDKIKDIEELTHISDLRKAKMAKFIIDLLFNDFINKDFKTKLDIIYKTHYDYNTHPYTYSGDLSVDKIYVHLINLDYDDILKIINDLTNANYYS